jgi:NAD-dependent deacetylase
MDEAFDPDRDNSGFHESDAGLERARELVARAEQVVVFTGAGISAESGIPTYRDAEESLWTKYDAQKVVQIDSFMRDSTDYWHFFLDVRYRVISDAKPNPGHLALAAMERAGKLAAVITQNIDGLHQAAGSERVIELHGNTRRIDCLSCGARYTLDEVYGMLAKTLPPPCKSCGGMLKPDVVFFGEALPEQALREASELARSCDVLIAIGSSLRVYPAAGLPEWAKANGAGLIIVNKTPTPFDQLADALLRGAAGELLPILARAAGAEG